MNVMVNKDCSLEVSDMLNNCTKLFYTFLIGWGLGGVISVRAKGAGGAAAPPENFFSGKTAKIYVISKRFSGKMFGQTGFLPPPSREIFWAKKAQNSGLENKIFFG